MIIKYPHCKLYYQNGKLTKKARHGHPIYEIKCDKCGKIFVEKDFIFDKRLLLINKEYCGKCSRPLMASLAGKKSTYDDDGNLKPNKGRFTSERVKQMSDEEYKIFCNQRKMAANFFHDKLKNDKELYEEHYKKVFKNSKIGYISKGQREIYELLKDYGFELEKNICGLNVDIVNDELKVIIEYYGDYFHANPRFYSPDEYIKIINKTASEKWISDRKRNFYLENNGYKIIIIWENKWKNDKESVIMFLEKSLDINFDNISYYSQNRRMVNIENGKSKIIKKESISEYLKNGWVLYNKSLHCKKGKHHEIIKN